MSLPDAALLVQAINAALVVAAAVLLVLYW
jgi:hypothetical protein